MLTTVDFQYTSDAAEILVINCNVANPTENIFMLIHTSLRFTPVSNVIVLENAFQRIL